VLIKEDQNKATHWLPVDLRAVFTVDMGCVHQQYKGVKIADLSSIWPASDFRQQALQAARKFVSDMRKRGYELVQNETDLLVWGPYRPRRWSLALSGNFVATSHTEYDTPLTVGAGDFLITGSFVSKYARATEVTV